LQNEIVIFQDILINRIAAELFLVYRLLVPVYVLLLTLCLSTIQIKTKT